MCRVFSPLSSHSWVFLRESEHFSSFHPYHTHEMPVNIHKHTQYTRTHRTKTEQSGKSASILCLDPCFGASGARDTPCSTVFRRVYWSYLHDLQARGVTHRQKRRCHRQKRTDGRHTREGVLTVRRHTRETRVDERWKRHVYDNTFNARAATHTTRGMG